ncbi:MAG TPA: hypothetical protein VMZ53_01490 [Kofleriaceae bacterium]|nr:hypothetical protein [Kofleriaceae bacterium]
MALRPRLILLAGWLGFMLYAFPGYMSYDSVYQLDEARWGIFSDGHPPAMAAMWRHVDAMIAGPLGMLIIQSVVFLAGMYLIFRERMKPNAAAFAAVFLLWFPPVAAFMAVIWKDSQMTAFILLGTGLILQKQRWVRVSGLVMLAVGTAMRHNALTITLPIVFLCFVWNPDYRWWKRYAIALVAWFGLTMSARVVSNALTDQHRYLWTDSIAMCDMAATLRYTSPTIPDAELRETFEGLRLWPDSDFHEFARRGDEEAEYVPTLWNTAYGLFAVPRDEAERNAMVRAWKKIVLTHREEYLTYRWKMFTRLLGFGGDDSSPVYNWFTDIQDPYGSATMADHDAHAGKLQDVLRRGMHAVGRTPLFRVYVYLALLFILLPFARDRLTLAVLGSAASSEVILFLIAPTTDWRYSSWMILAVVIAAMLIAAQRIRSSAPSHSG